MAQGVISKKYLIDIAEAIRVKLGSSDTYTPSEMATAISNITGGSGTITKSMNTDTGLITDTLMDGICDALRVKLGTQDTYAPSEIADAILTISGGGGVEIVPWATGTDEQIVAMIQAAHDGDIDLQTDGGWAVGDTRTISISAFTAGGNVAVAAQDIDIVITSFDDYMSCGNVLQFDFKDALAQKVRINSTASNTGGWGSSEMKTVTMPALVSALPSWLSENLIEFSVLSASGGGSSETLVTVGGNKLALRSTNEVIGNTWWTIGGEGTQLSYYTTASNRVKKLGKNGSADYWYSRSPRHNLSVQWMAIKPDGSDVGNYSADTAEGVAPFGCL